MSYKAVFGHERQIAVLQGAVTRDRVAHAYLFHGMEGIGKRTVAVCFAKTLLCTGGDGLDSCDRCPSCRKIDHGNHPDFITVEPDGAFVKIQAVKDMISAMAFHPLEGGRRIFLMADAEKMNAPAANALLKTLEEPSLSNLVILVTSRPYQLPATILSRCQPLRFQPLTRLQVEAFLRKRLHLEEENARTLASSSGGSVSRAMELNGTDYLEMRNDILDYLASDHLAGPLGRLLFSRFIGKDKQDLHEKLGVLKTCFRDVLVYRELGAKETLIHADREEIIRNLAGRTTTRKMADNIRVLDRAARALEQNANKTLTLDAAMFKLSL